MYLPATTLLLVINYRSVLLLWHFSKITTLVLFVRSFRVHVLVFDFLFFSEIASQIFGNFFTTNSCLSLCEWIFFEKSNRKCPVLTPNPPVMSSRAGLWLCWRRRACRMTSFGSSQTSRERLKVCTGPQITSSCVSSSTRIRSKYTLFKHTWFYGNLIRSQVALLINLFFFFACTCSLWKKWRRNDLVCFFASCVLFTLRNSKPVRIHQNCD